jgi:hypothetical protein
MAIDRNRPTIRISRSTHNKPPRIYTTRCLAPDPARRSSLASPMQRSRSSTAAITRAQRHGESTRGATATTRHCWAQLRGRGRLVGPWQPGNYPWEMPCCNGKGRHLRTMMSPEGCHHRTRTTLASRERVRLPNTPIVLPPIFKTVAPTQAAQTLLATSPVLWCHWLPTQLTRGHGQLSGCGQKH